jgi:hypothetical protein
LEQANQPPDYITAGEYYFPSTGFFAPLLISQNNHINTENIIEKQNIV